MYDATSSVSLLVRRTRSGLEAAGGSPLLLYARHRAYTLRLPLDPVYVEEDADGSEALRYRPTDMVAGKPYKFKWYGEWYALLKSKDSVEILKFCPDEK